MSYHSKKIKFIKQLIFLLAILSQLPLAFGNEKTGTECNKNSLRISKIIIVDSELYLDKNLADICIEGQGGFHVRTGGKLVIKDTEITLLSKSSSKTGAAFIKLEPGSTLHLARVKLISNLNTEIKEVKDPTSGTLNIEGSTNAIVGETGKNLGIRVEISDSLFISKTPYSTGGISIKSSTRNAKPISGWIVNTKFENIWSPITLLGANKFEVKNNKFKRNSGTNISISGSHVLISGNEIIFPGNG